MYIPKYFKCENHEQIKDFLSKNSFGILVSQLDNRIEATHIPIELDKDQNGKDVLLGHISRANPQRKQFENDKQVLAIFSGPQAYVSSSWYDHENVPTWNYIAVHIYGKIRIIEGDELITSLSKLVNKYEAASKSPVSVDTMSQEVLTQVHGIVGFEIMIEEIQAAYKLSQNRDIINIKGIVNELESKGDINSKEIAEEIVKNYPSLKAES